MLVYVNGPEPRDLREIEPRLLIASENDFLCCWRTVASISTEAFRAQRVRFFKMPSQQRTVCFRPVPDPHGLGTGQQDPLSSLRCGHT